MPMRIDLNKKALTDALEQAIASLKRSGAKQHNPLIKELIDKDIAMYQHAIHTAAEVK